MKQLNNSYLTSTVNSHGTKQDLKKYITDVSNAAMLTPPFHIT